MIVDICKIYFNFKEIDIKNRVDNYYFDYLIKAEKLEIKNILIDEKNYWDLIIYFTIYDWGKSIQMLSLYYHEIMGKTEEHEGKKNCWLMILC